MQLSKTPCAVLGKDSSNNIVIEYNLIDYPTSEWTNLFNRITSIVQIKSIINSKSVIVIMGSNMINFDVASIIKQKINETNQEMISDVLKNQIILSNFIRGLIVIHNDLRYSQQQNGNNPEGKSEYELYLSKIIKRMQEHDEYEDLLNINLAANK